MNMIEHPHLKPYELKPQTLKHVENKKFQTNLHMIHHWEGPELELAEFDYQHDRTPSVGTIPSQISNP